MRRRAAFTLSELLVAVALCASIVFVIAQTIQCFQSIVTVRNVQISADGSTVAASFGHTSNFIQVWDVATGASHRVTQDDDDWPLSTLALSNNGSRLIEAKFYPSINGYAVQQWDTETFTPHGELTLPGDYRSLAISADGRRASTSTLNTPAEVWELSDGTKLLSVMTPPKAHYVAGTALSANGETLAAGYNNGFIELWDMQTKQVRQQLMGEHCLNMSLAFSADGKRLAVIYHNENAQGDAARLTVWNIDTTEHGRQADLGDAKIGKVAFLPDGRLILDANSRLSWFDSDAGAIRTLLNEGFLVDAFAATGNGRLLVVAMNHEIAIWDGPTLRPLKTLWSRSPFWPIAVGLAACALCAGILGSLRRRRCGRVCSGCGRMFFPQWRFSSRDLCPACQWVALPATRKRNRILRDVAWGALFVVVFVFCFADLLEDRTGWPGYVTAAVVGACLLAVNLVGQVMLIRKWSREGTPTSSVN